MSRFDAIVVGGGVNGLTCAAYLARAGRTVLLVEARGVAGGAVVGPALGDERSPGPVDCSQFRRGVAEELGLAACGLRLADRPHRTLVIGDRGRWMHSTDDDETARSIGELSGRDAEGFRRFRRFVDSVAPVVRAFTDKPPLDIINLESEAKLELLGRALGLRRLGRDRMLDLLRVTPMTAADWLAEHFGSGLVKAGIAVPALRFAQAGPRAPGTAANVLLSAVSERLPIAGGGPALARALTRACRDAGVELMTGRRVTGLAVTDGRVTGVALDDGATVEAGAVLCACDPKQALLELVPRGALAARTCERMEHWRARGTLGHLVVRLRDELDLGGADRAVVVDDLDQLERAFDATKYGEVPLAPALELTQQAGEAGALVSVTVHHLPTAPGEGYTDGLRSRIERAALDALERAVPGVGERVEETVLLCPPDLERELHCTGGHLGHGAAALDQLLVRPIPECNGYRTPIAGLLLASAGSHGGAEPTGIPGRLAARAAPSALQQAR